MRATESKPDERGMALVVAILVLLVLTLLGIVMMAGVVTNRQVAGQSMAMRRALNNADAGVGEAISHLRSGDAAMPVANPRYTAQVFLAAAGSVPTVGTDTTALATSQAAGAMLPYSTATKSADVLTIAFKTNPARTQIYYSDGAHNPTLTPPSGYLPVYEITSTGTAGTARRTIIADVVAKPIYANVKGAMCAGLDVTYVGTADVCGHNHSASTPSGTGVPACNAYETHSGDMPATWSTGAVDLGGSSTNSGSNPSPYYVEHQTGFYAGPWEVLGMSQAAFISFMGAPTTNPSSLNGITYIDNDLILGNNSTSAAFHGATGDGILYVDGDLTLNAGFTYTGLIYVNGDLKLNGHAWILGAMVVKGVTSIKVNGTSTLLYSSDAISEKLAQYGGQYTTISWREK